MNWDKVKIKTFLSERKDRYAPSDANNLRLSRVEKIDFSGKIHLNESKSTKTQMILVKKGDLLISGINAEKGAVAIYEYDEDALASIHYSSYIYDSQKINIDFLKWYLKSPTFQKLLSLQTGKGIKSELKASQFLELSIALPTYEEQIHILNQINAVSNEIEELRLQVTENEHLISSLKQSILLEAIQGKLTTNWRQKHSNIESANKLLTIIKLEKENAIREKKIKKDNPLSTIKSEEVPFNIPENWVWCRAGDICLTISSGSTPPRTEFIGNGIPYLKVYNIKNQEIDFDYKPQFISYQYHSEKLKRSILKPGDIVLNIVGPPLGKTAIIPNTYPEWNCNQAIAFFKPVIPSMNLWLYNFFLSKSYLDRIELVGSAGQDNISISKCKNIEIPLPPIEEQIEIVNICSRLMATCHQLEIQIKQSKSDAAQLMNVFLSKIFRDDIDIVVEQSRNTEIRKTVISTRIDTFDNKSSPMELVKLLNAHGKLHAEDLWKMSEFPNDIDAFYAELKKQIEQEKTIKEVENEKGYLELV